MRKDKISKLLFFFFLASVFALAFAYISQFVFGYQPCPLCIYQRWPFFLILIFSAFALVLLRSKTAKKIVFFLCLVLLTANVAIASYHVCVERKIFKGLDSCESDLKVSEAKDLEELRNAMLQAKAVNCSEPSFIFLGLSMAAWNALYCLAIILGALLFLRNRNKNPLKVKTLRTHSF
jgi:disulfide bond formation protein DsbB